jgi:uncharacterized protein with NRDE domain
MCVAAVAWQAHPRWLLVAIGNRDEFHDRPAAPLTPWEDGSGIVAGRDLRSGGTWLGVSTAGRFALVTNLRGYGGPEPDRASRGALVNDWLAGCGRYADPDAAPLADFNPFNLILADRDRATFLSNRPDDVRTTLAHGIYGLSNGMLDEPWPKTLQLKEALLDWLNADAADFTPLFAAMRNERRGEMGLHPRQPSEVTREARDTAPFIADPGYGTRCSTVVAIDRSGRGTIVERRFSAAAEMTGETRLDFAWNIDAT